MPEPHPSDFERLFDGSLGYALVTGLAVAMLVALADRRSALRLRASGTS